MLAPGESVAAAYCWLARWSGNTRPGMPAAFEKIERAWHPGSCRFCDTPLPELMDMIDEAKDRMDPADDSPQQRAWRAFKTLKHKERLEVIRAAQEVPWYDEVTG